MDTLIQENKSKLNYTSCYFYNKENPQQAKLKLWGKKYYDYIQHKDYDSISTWMNDLGYSYEDVHWGNTRNPRIGGMTLDHMLKTFDPNFTFELHNIIEEDDNLTQLSGEATTEASVPSTIQEHHDDEVMEQFQKEIGVWCFCCKRTCPNCVKKAD
jgi:hypothetical protein